MREVSPIPSAMLPPNKPPATAPRFELWHELRQANGCALLGCVLFGLVGGYPHRELMQIVGSLLAVGIYVVVRLRSQKAAP
jgi:hypothetical protein